MQYIYREYYNPLSLIIFDEEYTYIHCAYEKIREKARKDLYPHSLFKHKLRISNREIYAIRVYYQGSGDNQAVTMAHIPYKVAYIFNAIIAILEEMWSKPDTPPIPPELANHIKQTYEIAFYEKPIKAYDIKFDSGDFGVDEVIKKELYNDFHSEESPFSKKFER